MYRYPKRIIYNGSKKDTLGLAKSMVTSPDLRRLRVSELDVSSARVPLHIRMDAELGAVSKMLEGILADHESGPALDELNLDLHRSPASKVYIRIERRDGHYSLALEPMPKPSRHQEGFSEYSASYMRLYALVAESIFPPEVIRRIKYSLQEVYAGLSSSTRRRLSRRKKPDIFKVLDQATRSQGL